MRKIYSALAWIVAAGVVVQAAAIAFGFGGMAGYVMDGGVVDKALMESQQATFTGDLGFPIHAIVGGMVIPFAAFALGIVSFLVRVPGARSVAGDVRPRVRPGHGRLLDHGPALPGPAPRRQRPARPRSRDLHAPGGSRSHEQVDRRCAGHERPRLTAASSPSRPSGWCRWSRRAGWASTRLGEYSVMSMGHVVDGRGGPPVSQRRAHHGGGQACRGTRIRPGGVRRPVDVTSLVADPSRPADVRVELVARRGLVQVPGAAPSRATRSTAPRPGRRSARVRATSSRSRSSTSRSPTGRPCTGTASTCPTRPTASPGSPRMPCRSAAASSTGSSREDAGTYWYHSHQMSHEQVERGLLGASWSMPARPPAEARAVDEVALLHVYAGQHTLNGCGRPAV